jgi:hypothetical protein
MAQKEPQLASDESLAMETIDPHVNGNPLEP